MQVGPVFSLSAVSIDLSATDAASVTQETTGSPSMSTVQAPQPPCPQPNLGELSPTRSRSTMGRFTAQEMKTATSRPLCLN